MSIPGGITVPSEARGDLYGDLPLRELVAQVISSLTFEGTHEATIDFRALPFGEAEGHERERDEQRQRVNSKYGGMTQPTPDHVQRELLFLYRGEAGSVDLAKESAGRERSVIDSATDESVRILKKEMKQKIHEWEGSFKLANGKEAGPGDKATLRPVYEVYKVAKNRITPSEGAPPIAPVPSASANAARSSTQHQPTQPAQPAPVAPGRPSASSAAPSVPSSTAAAATSAAGSAAAAGTAAAPGGGSGGGGGASAPPLAKRPTQEEAAIEKRKLKRKLHQFESDFERRTGRAPQREDRKEYSGEYARYAELKAMLNER